ncbi:MAG: phage head-tail connector protein [Sedimentisphaerales bacterium]|nr:phage head-tail connector protein [Sedimentisphaerales bacterium]
MAWKVTTPPSVEPVTLNEAKLHLRVDHTDEDALITSLIKVAREWCENFQNRAYITQTITLTLDEFPDVFTVPRPPLQSVTSIKYIDTDGVQQTLSSGIYDVDSQSEPGRIALAYGQSWPGIRGDINSVEVVYVAGYGDTADNVPERVKAAIKLLAGHLYEHREMVSEMTLKEVPFSVKSLLGVDRVGLV